jgi:hypothetical protein
MDAVTAVRLYPQYVCKDCIAKKKQAERGCEQDVKLGDTVFYYWNDIDGTPRARCPRRPIYENIDWYNSIITAYNFYKNGYLPHAGGMASQAALFPFVMATIDTIMAACDKAENDKGQSSGEGVSVLGKRPRNA